ncbi:MAG: hypothetical protein KatS3mg008_0246 [Acidimicrobiales bacterium]|nr:MAG: hypothetical protein KatS3mg008_0246 [Acidimicrobiales bacterium]
MRARVPVVEGELVRDPDGAVAAAEKVGWPVVLKASRRELAHKSERGLVRLGVGDPTEVRSVAQELLGDLDPSTAHPDEGVLVLRQIRSTRELLMGAHRDPIFGPVVVMGLGGVLAEALDDVSVRPVPIGRGDVEDMISELRSRAIFGEFRGERPIDTREVEAVLAALGRLLASDESIESVDLNPVMVEGRSLVAVDALVEVTA